ncbi:hypothetical protein E2320_005563 [Naja naja]|nr:hypothetical protein E2320_005563 [Naja naja]
MWTSLRISTEPGYPRDRSCGPRARFCVLAVGIAVILFLLGFLIGWLANKHAHQLPRTDAHKKKMEAFMKEMKAESIKEFLYNFTQQPHLAGTQENLHLAEQIQANWKAFGLDSVQLAPYEVLLSYPNETNPNYISLIDEHGQEGDLVYVNYGRIEDFHKLEREMGINCSGKIVIVRNAYLAGAKGLILYSDPADSCAPGVQPYPDGWNLPGGGAQRGNVLLLDEYAYRLKEAQSAVNLNIPVHPIGYHDAEKLLKEMGGAPAPDDSWKGQLSVPYNVGPGFTGTSSKRKVRMHIYSFKQVRRIYNVIGILRGATEPGWRPRRTVIFASWDAEEFGLMGSTEWAEENVKILQERAVAYINADSSIEGNYTLRVDCTPSMHSLVYNLTKEKVDKFSSYPVYHSVYETYEIVEKFYDPTFRNHLAVAQVRGGLVFELAEAVILPFDCRDYAKALNSYVDIIYNITMKHQAAMEVHKVSLDLLWDSVKAFSEVANDFHRRLELVDIHKHIIFAPNSHNKYAGVSFPGIYDALFDIDHKADQEKAWEEVKKQIFVAAFTVTAAAGTLKETL